MCHFFENDEWVSSDGMKLARRYAAAAQLQDGKLLVSGGYNNAGSINSVEILTENGWESNTPSLPVTIEVHCTVTVNSTTVMVIGGEQDGLTSGKTFYFTLGDESWIEGPELKYKRYRHTCGKVRRDKESQDMSIVVAGGWGESFLASVEILDEGSNEWRTGPELPFGVRYSQMVEDPNGGVIVIGGESPEVDYLDTLLQLPNGGQDAVWTMMVQKMKTGRDHHTAFLIPDIFVDCS
jgi:N-acetylneuraminic acid mutarotase